MVAETTPPSIPLGQLSDVADILAAIGEVAYRWQIDSDALVWSANACGVLNISDATAIASGRAFAVLLDPGNTQSRDEAVMNSPLRDSGSGVLYHVQYAINAGPAAAPF